nr:6384_t:CDS:2 [Entrophospora candida]CAG8529295.1 3786_t:CDS:2 [Entrophospora candida]
MKSTPEFNLTITGLPITLFKNSVGEHNKVPFPQGNYIQAVRTSCHDLTKKNDIKVNEEAVINFIQKIDSNHYNKLSENNGLLNMPLRFDTLEQELNIIGLFGLLNFGSGYRQELHEECGPFDTIRYGIMSLHITSQSLSSHALRSIKLSEVSSLFQIPLQIDVPHKTIQAITISQPSKSRVFAEIITWVLNDTGKILEDSGYKDFAMFLIDASKPERGGEKPKAAKMVEKLVKAFPTFRDMAMINDQPVYVFKKAQFLASSLYHRFQNNTKTSDFDFEDINELTIDGNNVVPAILYHANIMNLPSHFKKFFEENNKENPNIQEIYCLRAAAIDSCEIILRHARSLGRQEISLKGLDKYIWQLGKNDNNNRQIEGFVIHNTMFF